MPPTPSTSTSVSFEYFIECESSMLGASLLICSAKIFVSIMKTNRLLKIFVFITTIHDAVLFKTNKMTESMYLIILMYYVKAQKKMRELGGNPQFGLISNSTLTCSTLLV